MRTKRHSVNAVEPLQFDWAFIWQIKTYFFCPIFDCLSVFSVCWAQVCAFIHDEMTVIGSFWFTILFIYLFYFVVDFAKLNLNKRINTAEIGLASKWENLGTSMRQWYCADINTALKYWCLCVKVSANRNLELAAHDALEAVVFHRPSHSIQHFIHAIN